MRERILQMVIAVIRELNEEREKKIDWEKGEESILYARDSGLDSLSLVSLIIALEENIEETFGVAVTLADEKAMSRKHSPFRSIGALVDYATLRIQEEGR